jgi:hypothetical protein
LLSATCVSGAAANVTVNVNLGPPPPVVVAAPPALVLVPGVPVVQYVASLQVDLFVHDERWYYPHGGYWYVGPSYRGPWTPIAFAKLPQPIVVVPVQYYNVPPGHLKHKDKGARRVMRRGRGRGSTRPSGGSRKPPLIPPLRGGDCWTAFGLWAAARSGKTSRDACDSPTHPFAPTGS